MKANDTINGRTPDEIKTGLECHEIIDCYNSICPYFKEVDCLSSRLSDALTYIQQLERERDAAVKDIKEMGEARPYCGLCAHEKVGIDEAPCGTCREGYIENNWQWRGLEVE